jgi:flagellar biosynthesis regulator FlaF
VTLADIARAYRATQAALDPREQEADVFRRVTGRLRAAVTQDGPSRMRAIADNRRLWLAIEGALADPANRLPVEFRAALISLARAVQREMDGPDPDLDFLIEVNDQVAAGLAARG